MPPRAIAAIDWDDFIKLWAIPEAESFLSQAASEPLPRRGRLQQLLVKTQQVLSRAAEADEIQLGRTAIMHYKQAEAAVEARAVVLLARLMHVLQRSPSSPSSPTSIVVHQPWSSVWWCVTYALCTIVQTIQQKHLEMCSYPTELEALITPVMASCRQQLKEAAGM